MKDRLLCGPWAVTMTIEGWSEQEGPEEDRNPKKRGWEGKKVVSRSPRRLCLPPVRRPVGDQPLTRRIARHMLRVGPQDGSCSSAWTLQEGWRFLCGLARQAQLSAFRVDLQDLSLGSLLGGDTPVFPVSNLEPGLEQGLIRYLMRWRNK